eukprot:CAMPEP_0176195124 /NCGR_PEP_ID=MMETSP0121_2-20121125/6353_1 /TAXON_ID=160619 /ORGANISM="Kryptoperidinium foliaceum, Strain CCMP 1326" /LENGTH=98 /DNA_ID=CAMNT_0017533889 /DNA_START=222 /DNA_END=518 /DNA_ORIENTATION=-
MGTAEVVAECTTTEASANAIASGRLLLAELLRQGRLGAAGGDCCGGGRAGAAVGLNSQKLAPPSAEMAGTLAIVPAVLVAFGRAARLVCEGRKLGFLL